MQEILGANCQIIEAGALDDLSRAEVAELSPRQGDYVLVTRLRDGVSVQIAEHHILPRMQEQIGRVVEEGAEVVALLCTGEFPGFRSSRLVVEPQRVLNHFVAAVAAGRRLGVVVPVPEQIEEGEKRWRPAAADLRIEAGSPYTEMTDTERAVDGLKAWGADLIVLDCMGFARRHKERAAEIARVPVVLPRTVLARTLAELL